MRHHVDIDEGYFILDVDESTGKLRFKLVPFDIHAHDKIHDAKLKKQLDFISELINARMLHLYEIFMKDPKNTSLQEFRARTETINRKNVSIWEDYPDKVLQEWLERYRHKESLYKNHYPYFDKHFHQAMIQDFERYKKKDPACKQPEFWYWYLNEYDNMEKIGKVL